MQPSNTDLTGRRGLVIGVETPAGGAIALALGEAGADLGLAAMRADDGVVAVRRIQRRFREQGRRAAAYAFDVTLSQNVKVSTRQVAKELGGLDFVVSASNLPYEAPLIRTSDSDLARVTTVNYYSHVFAIRAAVDEFRRGEGGQILLVVSNLAEQGAIGASAYAAAHAATLNLVHSLGEELRAERVGINAVVGASEAPDAEELGGVAVMAVRSDPAAVTGQIFRLARAEWSLLG